MIIEITGLFIFLHPAVMAVYWSIAGIIYFVFMENKRKGILLGKMPAENIPLVSIMMPCYNEADQLEESIPHLLTLQYPNYELILINDGSSDKTGEIIDRWAQKNKRITALHQKNSGKASALNNALNLAKGKYVLCIDGDAVLDYSALDYMVMALEKNPVYAAVTGNPRVRNRSTILGCLQVSEFSAIIGLIKRAQSLIGTIFTVSGVCCLFNAEIIRRLGGWSTDMLTEDLDISWKLQTAGYNIYYEPRAICWVLMPERLGGLFKQRLRWAQGGAEVIIKYFPQVWRFKNRRLWPMYIEYLVTANWVFLLLLSTIASFYGIITGHNMLHLFETSLLKPGIILLFFTFLLQFLCSLYIDSKYENGLFRYAFHCIWYPWAYWLIGMATLAIGLPRAIFRKKSQFAVWTSPDRGV
ncbi:poly-beta-1,6-N-acetyl-D-glucosamine synthase [Mesocricetibacter intestinalis]|nr:poly-beta-1,6-N-acetyl-D-glucosamine synthase [Mesocricetibacter intestinalis]